MVKRSLVNGEKRMAAEEERAEKISHACEKVMFCLQPSVRSNITLFNLNSDDDLSETIFKSISTCKRINLTYFDCFLLFIDMFSI